MKHYYLDLDLIRLATEDGAVHLDKQFILIDTFDEMTEGVQAGSFFVNHPVKLSFTVVIFCISGWMKFQISLQNYVLNPNDILIVQEGTIGEYRGMSEDAKIVVIALGNEYFQMTNQFGANTPFKQWLYTSPICHLKPKDIQEAMTVYGLMKQKITEKDNPFRKEALMGYMQVLTYNTYKYLIHHEENSKIEKERKSRQQEIYDSFIKEIQKNYTKERSISYYADLLCITPKYLSQVVRKVSGRFAGDWINDFVILEAKALLKSRKYTIQQVADMLNFANQSFFGKYFKEKVGCSPSEYQKQSLK